WKALLLIAGLQPILPRQQPDLQEMDRLRLRGIELAVADAGAGTHALHLARPDHRAGADAVLVLERALENIGDDLHVAMAMRVETGAGLDAILVDDAQRAEAHMARIVIVAERKTVPAGEPAETGKAALFGGPEGDHGGTPRCREVSAYIGIATRRGNPPLGRGGVVRAQRLAAGLGRLGVDEDEGEDAGRGAVVHPGMHRAALDHHVALFQMHRLAVIELKIAFAREDDRVIERLGGVHEFGSTGQELGDADPRALAIAAIVVALDEALALRRLGLGRIVDRHRIARPDLAAGQIGPAALDGVERLVARDDGLAVFVMTGDHPAHRECHALLPFVLCDDGADQPRLASAFFSDAVGFMKKTSMVQPLGATGAWRLPLARMTKLPAVQAPS